MPFHCMKCMKDFPGISRYNDHLFSVHGIKSLHSCGRFAMLYCAMCDGMHGPIDKTGPFVNSVSSSRSIYTFIGGLREIRRQNGNLCKMM